MGIELEMKMHPDAGLPPCGALMDLEPGGHVGAVYEKMAEQLDLLVPFIIGGLKRGKKVWLSIENPAPQLFEKLAEEGLEVTICRALGQLVLQPLPLIRYTQNEIATRLREEVDRALREGYTGLQLAVEIEEEKDPEKAAAGDELLLDDPLNDPLLKIESGLDPGLIGRSCAVLCLHRRTDFKPDRLWRLLQAHSFVTFTSSPTAAPKLPVPPPPETQAWWHKELPQATREFFIMMDPDLHYVYWDPAISQITQIPVKQALGKQFGELFPDLKAQGYDKIYRKVLERKEPQIFDFEFAPQGQPYSFQISAYPIGRGVAVFAREITARRQVEETQREREAYHTSFFENRFEPMLLIEPDTGRIIDANPAACTFYGYERESFKKMSVVAIDGQAAEGEHSPLEDFPLNRQESRFELRHRQPNGEIREVEIHSGPIWRHGRELIYAIVHDITDLRKAERALKKSQERLSRLVETVPSGIIFATPNGRVQFMNSTAEKILGVKTELAMTLNYEDLKVRITDLHGRPFSEKALTFRQVLISGEPIYNVWCAVRRLDEKQIFISVNSAPLKGPEGEIEGVVSSLTDITEQVLAAKERNHLLAQVERGRAQAQQQAEKWNIVFNTLMNAVTIHDATGRVVTANPAAIRLLGMEDLTRVDRQCLLEKMNFRNAAGQSLNRLEEFPIIRALRGETVIEELFMFTNGAGNDIIVRASISPLLEDAQSIGAVAVWQDVTEREQLLRQIDQERQRAEQLATQVLQEHRTLQVLIDTMPTGMIGINAQGQPILSNRTAETILGGPSLEETPTPRDQYTLHDLDGRPLTLDDSPLRRALLFGEKTVNRQTLVRRRNGEERIIMESTNPIYDEAGHPQGAVTVFQDITFQHQLELETREQRRQFETLAGELETILGTLDIGIVITDRDHRITRINRAMAEEIGRPIDALIGRPIEEITGYPEGNAMRRQVLETGKRHRWEALAYRFPQTHPQLRYWDIAMAPIPNPEGPIESIVTTYTEVTRHVQARQSAELERARWLTILTTIPLTVIFVAPDGQVQVANSQAQELWQRPLVGMDWREIAAHQSMLNPETGSEISPDERPIARALQGEVIRNFEVVFVQAHGERIPMLFHATPVWQDGKVVGVIQVGQDLTRLKEADRIKDQFLAMVSHDLRSPLATIKGWALMAQESYDPETIQRALDLILKGAQTQQRLIDDLLDSAALAIGTLRVTPEVQDIRPIVESVCLGAEASGRERGIALTWALPEIPVLVAVDAVRLQQILGNLITNAYKFTPKGGQVEIQLTHEEREAVLQVHDTGHGILPEQLPHIFERFFSGSGTQTPTSRSLGLGLAIVKALVELHGGQVSASSEGAHRGSTFSIRLPLAPSPQKK